MIVTRALGVHRYCAQPAADHASPRLVENQRRRSVPREAPIDSRRIERLRLRAELDEWPAAGFQVAPPRHVRSRSVPSSRVRPSTTRLPVLGVQQVDLLRRRECRRRREPPLQVADQRGVGRMIERVRIGRIVRFRAAPSLPAIIDTRSDLARRQVEGELRLRVREAERRCRSSNRSVAAASRCSSCATATSQLAFLLDPSGPSHTVVAAEALSMPRTVRRSREPSRVVKSSCEPRCELSRCGCGPDSSVADSRMSLLIRPSEPVSSTPRTV